MEMRIFGKVYTLPLWLEKTLNVLKKMEGFNKYPKWDYSHYSIGWGSTCPDDKYEYYKANGVTESTPSAVGADIKKPTKV